MVRVEPRQSSGQGDTSTSADELEEGDNAIIRESCAVDQVRVGYDDTAHYDEDCDSTVPTGCNGVAHSAEDSESTVFREYDRKARFDGASVVFNAEVRRNSQLCEEADEQEDEACGRSSREVKARPKIGEPGQHRQSASPSSWRWAAGCVTSNCRSWPTRYGRSPLPMCSIHRC